MRHIDRGFGPRLHFTRVEARARLLHIAIRHRARHDAIRLRRIPGAQAYRLAEALERVAADDLAPDVRRRIARIESVRLDTLRSKDAVEWADGRRESLAWICARASQPPSGARLLHHVLAAWRPSRALELGTCVGISGAYQATALSAGAGGLTSLEAYPDLARRAEENWTRAGVDNAEVVVGRFETTLPSVLARGEWDYAFIDGNHQGRATQSYVDRIAEVAAPGALLALDDIDYNDGMRLAWTAVQQREDVVASAQLGKIGLLALR